ncbi:MAG: methyl-accepting chemotaxis protein [Planctomycetota bacterium]
MKWVQKMKSLGLTTRIVTLVVAVVVAVVAVNYIVFVKGYRASAEQALVDKAAAFTATADATKDYAAQQLHGNDAFDKASLLEDLRQVQAEGRPYTDAKIFSTVPVVVGWKAAAEAAEREDIDFRITAFETRNADNNPDTEFSRQLLEDLTDQAEAGDGDTISRVDPDDPAGSKLHYMRAIRVTDAAGCMTCHGDPATSPTGDGKDILGFPMENWPDGYIHGAYHVAMPMAPVESQVASFISHGLMWTAPLVIGATVLFVLMLSLMFGRPVKQLIERIRDIAEGEGDLTQRIDVKSDDELGQLGRWFNQFVQRIHDVMVTVAGSTHEVASAATEIAASSEEISTGMGEQSAQVTQISAAVEEMSASVVEVARKSADASKNAEQSGKAATEGGRIVEQTINEMNAISEAVNASSRSVQDLGQRGEQIGEIISVINDIADQTNLLALNAAIEAARAGEHGRGFAVVADEVRKLADRTTQATDEISQSIKAIQSETTSAVERMGEGTRQVEVGVNRATDAGTSLTQIVSNAREVAGMIQSIAAATEEQSAASEEVARTIEAIAAVTQQSKDGTDQAAIAAVQLSEQAERLQTMVGKFKVDSDMAQGS